MIKADELKTRHGMSEVELAELDASASAYERGEWPTGKVTRIGRPSIASEEVRPITVRLPVSQITALDHKAAKFGTTRSSAVREAIGGWLEQA
jgi:hypothetical protein